MLDHQHWLDRWTENRIGFHQSSVNAHLQQHFPNFNLPANSAIFMPLCGKAHDIAWLAQQGFEVIGIELSSIAIEAFFEENSLSYQTFQNDRFVLFKSGSINLLQGDFFDLKPDDLAQCRFIYDRASLIAMEQDQRPDYFKHMKALFPEGREMLLITLEYDQLEMGGPPFSVVETEVQQQYGEQYRIELLERHDILDEGPRWRKVGLSALHEVIYRLTPRGASESTR
ncbi:MAG: thiopurine S-methyltransferase [Pseudomonadota bacterium]